MATFESSEKLKQVLGGFFEDLLKHPEMGPKFLASKLVLKFNYTDPSLSITADLSGPAGIVTFDDATKKPDVEMSMKADVAHRFWLGKVNLVIALARREMVAKGPIPKILKLLPVIKPAYVLYPEYLKKNGFESLVAH